MRSEVAGSILGLKPQITIASVYFSTLSTVQSKVYDYEVRKAMKRPCL